MPQWQAPSLRQSPTMLPITPLFLLFALLKGSSSKTLIWLVSSNYNSTSNWSEGRLPCSTDRVQFPERMGLTVELPGGKTAIKEILLPSDGELVLQRDSTLVISSKDLIDGSCDGGVNRWLREDGGRWLDPDNWAGASPVAPDLEKIPCPHDTVVFPAGTSFRVELPPFTLPVHGVYIKGQLLTGEEWEDYESSEEGERQFSGGPLESTGEDCSEPTGCECPAQWLQRWICPNKACPLPNCLAPVKPLGSCCLVCGAFMLYRFSSVMRVKAVEAVVRSELGPQVSWHVGRTMGYLQVVIGQDENSEPADDLAKILNNRLLSDHRLGLISKSLTASGPSYSERSAGSPFFIFFLSMIFVIVAAGVAFYYFERRRLSWPLELGGGRRFVSARFENLTGRLEIAQPRVVDDPAPRGFDNPMYSQDGEGFTGGLEDNLDAGSLSEDTDSSTSYDRKTVTTLAVAEEPAMEDVPIGQLIG